MSNLWNLGNLKNTRIESPDTLIIEQARQLEQLTDNYIYLKSINIKLEDVMSDYNLRTIVNIVAPAIGNYNYPLFLFDSKVSSVYPINVVRLFGEDPEWAGEERSIETHEAFIRELEDILANETTQNVVKTLYNKSLSSSF